MDKQPEIEQWELPPSLEASDNAIINERLGNLLPGWQNRGSIVKIRNT